MSETARLTTGHEELIGDTVAGAFAEYVKVPAANAYPIPDAVSDAQAP